MNPDSARTQVTPPTGDAGITLTLDLPARLADAATIQDAALALPTANEASSRVRYAILGQAGRGGMATVHVARDLELMRKVALKQLSDELRSATSARQRFLREVQITAQLDHPYIVPVYGLEVAPGGAPAYAMKLVEGRTLSDYLEETRDAYIADGHPDEGHSLAARLEHFLKVCDAVDYAHGKGVIHRDLKPANVMLGPHGEIYVMDWGICRLFDRDDAEVAALGGLADTSGGHQTEFGAVVGTPRYMSPEQAQGRSDELGPRSDQCALGLMLYELVTLRSPLEGETVHKVLEQAAHGRRGPVTHAYERRAVPKPLRAIIERATRYDAAQRYDSVRALGDDLRRFLRGEAVHALPDSLWQRAQRFVGRHRQGVLLGLFGIVAVAALGTAALMWRHEQTLLAAQARERHLRALVDDAAQHGDRLQLRLLDLRSEVSAIAVAASLLLQHGDADPKIGFHWESDYRDAVRRPADYAVHPGFGRPVSLEWAVWYAAPGVARETVEPEVRRLHPLRDFRNELFALARETLGGGEYDNGIAEVRIALADGLTMRYPGRQLETLDDSRLAPWYQRATAERGAQWSTPFLNAEGDTVLLPLGEALRAADGRVLGAVSIDLALDYIVRNLVRDEAPGRASHRLLLLDPAGNVLAAEEPRPPQRGAAEVQVELLPFGDATLRAVVTQQDVGVVTTQAFGRPELVAFDRIHPLDWVLVLVAPDPSPP